MVSNSHAWVFGGGCMRVYIMYHEFQKPIQRNHYTGDHYIDFIQLMRVFSRTLKEKRMHNIRGDNRSMYNFRVYDVARNKIYLETW